MSVQSNFTMIFFTAISKRKCYCKNCFETNEGNKKKKDRFVLWFIYLANVY
jgi:hypothetical protein